VDKKSEFIHLPDLQFIQLCISYFGINRGVYNTIDNWFFENGIMNILERRSRIYHFLSKCHEINLAKDGKIKFGPGNLSRILTEYSKKYYRSFSPITKITSKAQ
jgi:hypothetical protein